MASKNEEKNLLTNGRFFFYNKERQEVGISGGEWYLSEGKWGSWNVHG